MNEIKSGALHAIAIDGARIEKELMVIYRRGLPADSIIIKFTERLACENMRSAC
jgi:hypothetical protein